MQQKQRSERPSMLSTFSTIATTLAMRSTCSSRAAVGAILYDDDNHIISTGYNGAPKGMPHCDDVGCRKDAAGHCLNAIHAEENAILQAAIVGRSTKGLHLFVTHSPCWRCTMKLIQAGIRSVTYREVYGDDIVNVVDVLTHCHVLVYRFDGLDQVVQLAIDKGKR